MPHAGWPSCSTRCAAQAGRPGENPEDKQGRAGEQERRSRQVLAQLKLLRAEQQRRQPPDPAHREPTSRRGRCRRVAAAPTGRSGPGAGPIGRIAAPPGRGATGRQRRLARHARPPLASSAGALAMTRRLVLSLLISMIVAGAQWGATGSLSARASGATGSLSARASGATGSLSARESQAPSHAPSKAPEQAQDEDPASQAAGRMEQVGRQMLQAQQLLGQEDVGRRTQDLQEQIVVGLDQLIDQIRSQQKTSIGPGQKMGPSPKQNDGNPPGKDGTRTARRARSRECPARRRNRRPRRRRPTCSPRSGALSAGAICRRESVTACCNNSRSRSSCPSTRR